MANYALDEENRIVAAKDAYFKKKYQCIECRSFLKKRSGRQKRPHFFHLGKTPSCRLYGKGFDHLALQHFLQNANPALKIECPFQDIGRIADLAWEERKILFEIQCSPISFEEVKARTEDYSLKGYRIVWLLDDRLYNKKRAGPAERFMRKSGYYFSLAKNLIYDQSEFFDQERRLMAGPKLPVDLTRPEETFFAGDLSDMLRRHPEARADLEELEQSLLQEREKPSAIKKIIYIVLEFLLRTIAKK
jgi:competence protein CoiA